MAATPYRPLSFTDKSLTQEKLQQMANNEQWLFENSPRIRYNYLNGSIIRDSGIKIIAGKTAYGAQSRDYADVFVYFGSFFSAACKPVVTATAEPASGRAGLSIAGISFGVEIDYRGFRAHVYQDFYTPANISGGWVNWTAVGF